MHRLAILSFFKKMKIGNCPRVGHLRTVLKPLGGVTGVFVSRAQPYPNQFSCLSQNTLWKDQESPQKELRDWNKISENFARNRC